MTVLMHDLRREANELFEKAGFQNRPPFLHRAQSDDFLLCSDAPRRLFEPAYAAQLFHDAGLPLAETDGLWFLDARACDYERLDGLLPAYMPKKPPEEKYMHVWALCRMLYEHISPAAGSSLWAVRRTLKAMEAGQAQVLSMAEGMMPRLAELLRNKEPLPALAGKLLALWLMKEDK